MLKLLENHLKTQLEEPFFQNFNSGNIFENFDSQKTAFLVKFDIKIGSSDSFPFQKCILLYTSQL